MKKIFQNLKNVWLWILGFIFFPITIIFLFCVFALNPNSMDGGYTRENVAAPTYTTTEDFHKLTGVEFPEMVLVDSFHYNDGLILPL